MVEATSGHSASGHPSSESAPFIDKADFQARALELRGAKQAGDARTYNEYV